MKLAKLDSLGKEESFSGCIFSGTLLVNAPQQPTRFDRFCPIKANMVYRESEEAELLSCRVLLHGSSALLYTRRKLFAVSGNLPLFSVLGFTVILKIEVHVAAAYFLWVLPISEIIIDLVICALVSDVKSHFHQEI